MIKSEAIKKRESRLILQEKMKILKDEKLFSIDEIWHYLKINRVIISWILNKWIEYPISLKKINILLEKIEEIFKF